MEGADPILGLTERDQSRRKCWLGVYRVVRRVGRLVIESVRPRAGPGLPRLPAPVDKARPTSALAVVDFNCLGASFRTYCAWAWLKRGWILRGIVALVGLCRVVGVASGQGKDPFAVKAAFLCNFTKFAEWPAQAFADAESPLVVAIYGEDPFGAKLDAAASGLTVHGRKLQIRRLKDPPRQGECHLLFVGRPTKEAPLKLDEIQALLLQQPILTVGDQKNFAADGGCIGFVESGGAIHFQVNLAASDLSGVKLNSGLLKLADNVFKTLPRNKP